MGMKANSGLFHTTNGAGVEKKLGEFVQHDNTSVVWKYINATAENYPGTVIPKSFNIITPVGVMWTHVNATEHMYEALSSGKLYPEIKNSNPKLYAQFILYDYYQALGKAVKRGIKYETLISSGNWEFVFSRPRRVGGNPVVKHAKFSGLK